MASDWAILTLSSLTISSTSRSGLAWATYTTILLACHKHAHTHASQHPQLQQLIHVHSSLANTDAIPAYDRHLASAYTTLLASHGKNVPLYCVCLQNADQLSKFSAANMSSLKVLPYQKHMPALWLTVANNAVTDTWVIFSTCLDTRAHRWHHGKVATITPLLSHVIIRICDRQNDWYCLQLCFYRRFLLLAHQLHESRCNEWRNYRQNW